MSKKDIFDGGEGESNSDGSIEVDTFANMDSLEKSEENIKLQQNFEILQEEALNSKKVYVLNLGADTSFSKLAAGRSNGNVDLFNLDSVIGLVRSETIEFPGFQATCGVKFLNNSNELLIGNQTGQINLYDLRTLNKCHSFGDLSLPNNKTITCFDVNCNDRIVCAGTNQINSDVYLLFYDIRQKKLLGAYWECHQDDVTSLKFHGNKADLLVSGSTDGLINIYDVSQTNENDALQNTVNTESSIDKLNWHKNVYEKDFISCITHTNDLKIYDADEVDCISQFDRKEIENKFPILEDLNLIDCHNLTDDNEIFLLATSRRNNGKILRSLKLHTKNLLPLANFSDNKQIIRDSLYNRHNKTLITSGEKGIVTLWSADSKCNNPDIRTDMLKLRRKTVERIHKKKPY